MAIAIRPIDTIAGKWKEVTPQRAGIYEQNVKTPLRNWEENTLAAKERQKAGMTKALQEDRVAKGVSKAGQAKWVKATTTKGPGRWQEGVNLGEVDYKAGFAPYYEVISGLTLPEKYAKGDPRNYERAKVVGLALHNKKTQG